MATTREYMDFILEQLSELDGITYRRMMGEYIIYYKEKIAAYVCDNRLLVKILPSSERLLPDARREPPYDGARDMLLVEDVENKEFLRTLFDTMYPEMTGPKKKRAKKE